MSDHPITKDERERAIKDCEEAGCDPYDYLDYADLRRGVQNWRYYIPGPRGKMPR